MKAELIPTQSDQIEDLDPSVNSLEEPAANDEEERLGKKSPLKTVLTLSVGPLISQMVIALYGIVNSLLVAKSIGNEGVAVIGAVFIVEFIPLALSEYCLTGMALRASFLFGKRERHKIDQLFVDFIRIALIFGVLMPSIILPITKPLIHWFGATDHLATMCFQYMIPPTAGSAFNFIFQISLGLIQAEGRTFLYGIIQIISFVLNIIFLCVSLLWLKLPIWSASLSVNLSQGIPGLILLYFIFKKKLGIEPALKMFCNKFSVETKHALQVAFASLIAGISYTLPMVLMQKFVNMAATAIGEYEYVVAIWGVINKLYALVGGICIGFNFGFVPPASFAFGANLKMRVIHLSMHMLWIATTASSILGYIFVIFPDKIATLWEDNEKFLYWAKKMIPLPFYGVFCHALQYMVPALLQAVQMVLDATVISVFVFFVTYLTFPTILYFTNKRDPARILYSYALCDCFALTACIVALIRPFRRLKQGQAANTNENSENNELKELDINSGPKEKDVDVLNISDQKFQEDQAEEELPEIVEASAGIPLEQEFQNQ